MEKKINNTTGIKVPQRLNDLLRKSTPKIIPQKMTPLPRRAFPVPISYTPKHILKTRRIGISLPVNKNNIQSLIYLNLPETATIGDLISKVRIYKFKWFRCERNMRMHLTINLKRRN